MSRGIHMSVRKSIIALFVIGLGLAGGIAAAADPADKTITLDEAIHQALEENFGLQMSRTRARAAEGAARSAGAFLNPELEVEVENFRGDLPIWHQSETTYAISQTLEAPGKRGARSRAANHGAVMGNLAVAADRLDLAAEVKRAFLEVLGAQERLRFAEDALGTAEEVREAVAGLVEAGEVAAIENARAEGELAMARVELLRVKQELSGARRALSRLWGSEEPDFQRADGSLTEQAATADPETLREGLKNLPDLALRREGVERHDEALLLARRERVPDVTLRFGRRDYAETGDHAYVAGIAIPLPLWNRNSGGIIEASARHDEAVLELKAEEVRLRSRLEGAIEVLNLSGEEVRAIRETVLPQTRRVFEAIREGYRRGKFALLDLLEARRKLIEVEGRYVESLVRLGHARTEVERLAGSDISINEGGAS